MKGDAELGGSSCCDPTHEAVDPFKCVVVQDCVPFVMKPTEFIVHPYYDDS